MNREFIQKERQMDFSSMKISSTSNIMEKHVSPCGSHLHFYQKWKQESRRMYNSLRKHTHTHNDTSKYVCTFFLKLQKGTQEIITCIARSE